MLTDKERDEYQEQAEQGRKAALALEFLSEYITEQRAGIFLKLEELEDMGEAPALIVYLKVLRGFERNLTRYIGLGEVAERRLNEDGD